MTICRKMNRTRRRSLILSWMAPIARHFRLCLDQISSVRLNKINKKALRFIPLYILVLSSFFLHFLVLSYSVRKFSASTALLKHVLMLRKLVRDPSRWQRQDTRLCVLRYKMMAIIVPWCRWAMLVLVACKGVGFFTTSILVRLRAAKMLDASVVTWVNAAYAD